MMYGKRYYIITMIYFIIIIGIVKKYHIITMTIRTVKKHIIIFMRKKYHKTKIYE